MEASTTVAPRTSAPVRVAVHAEDTLWLAAAVLFASTSVVVGVLWDISWHSSIGRDTFWSPPHLAIYLGGVVAGIACAVHVLRTSFAGTREQKDATVGFWRYFRGHFGAWVCIWGTFAMLTSAPFDDWWHNAYGLDVKILSPPHAVLALGILAIQLGAMFMVLALQNRSGAAAEAPEPKAKNRSGAAAEAPEPEVKGEGTGNRERGTEERRGRLYRWMFAYAAALVLMNFAIMVSEYTWRIFQHGTLFYQIVCGVLLMPIVAGAVPCPPPPPPTAATGMYLGVLLLLVWIFPLFPAEPKLAPVRFPLTQMVPPQFPLLLVVPALGLDLVLQRWRRSRGWLLAGVLAAVFLALFVAAQWPFAEFLNSPAARNPLFGQHLRPYMIGETSFLARGEFLEPAAGMALVQGLTIALGLGVVSARLGLAWGGWMRGVRR
jgi:hypothetical protein